MELEDLIGTPITGNGVIEATIPGKMSRATSTGNNHFQPCQLHLTHIPPCAMVYGVLKQP